MIDASIYSQVQQPQAPNLLASLAQAYQIQNAQQQNQLGAVQLQDAQRTAKGNTAADNAYAKALNPDGTVDQNRLLTELANGGAGSRIPAVQKGFADTAKAKTEQDAAAFKLTHDRQQAIAEVVSNVTDQPSYDAAIRQVRLLGGDVSKIPAAYDPAFVAQQQALATTQADKLKAQLTKQGFDVTMRGQDMSRQNSIDTNNTSRANNASTVGATMRGQDIGRQNSIDTNATSRANNTATIQAGFKTAGLDNQGNYVDGQSALGGLVDAIGQGKITESTALGRVTPAAKAQIMSQVAQKYPDYDPTTIAAKTKAARDFATGNQGNALRSFAVATNHLDTLGKLTDALGNGDIQLFNKLGNQIASQTGNAAPTNFETAKSIVSKEVIKAIVGSAGGVSDREEAGKLLDAAHSPKQLRGAIDQISTLMGAQREALMTQRRAAGLPDSTLPNYVVDSAPATTGAHPADISSLLDKYGGKR